MTLMLVAEEKPANANANVFEALGDELALALEKLAYARLDEENTLCAQGRFHEAEQVGAWRRAVRDAATLVRSSPQDAWIRLVMEASPKCPLCPQPLRNRNVIKCKFHRR